MLHAVIIAETSVEALAQTLADLVPGAVEGVLKRATVAAPLDADEPLFEVAAVPGAVAVVISLEQVPEFQAERPEHLLLLRLHAGPPEWA